MSSSKGSSAMRNMMYGGRNSLLPPKCPFPSPAPAYGDYVPSSVIGPKATAKAFPGNPNHQRTSSESLLIDEQPSWLDELLNEPETPVRRGGHRRSSSDSFAYIEAANAASFDFMTQDDIRFSNLMPASSWGSQDFDHFRDAQRSFVPEINAFTKHRNRPWDASPNSIHHLRGIPPPGNNLQNPGTYRPQQEADVFPVAASEKQDNDSSHQDMKGSFEKKDSSNGKPAACETDTKRAKQQFAQRSRVRKLQYIAELERNVQALQVEGVEVSAELEFLNQQHLILSMENKALKQRLESLAQEQLIKYVEHDVLERELGRLRALYQQQQPPPLSLQPQKHQTPGHQRRGSKDFDLQHQVSGHQRKSSRDLDLQHQVSGHQRKSSRDLDLQLANLSLKQQTDNTSSACDHVPRQLNI